ncbi:MAG: hypothetical protein KU28_01665 [Sulfurovum sp. PC08-66]|nr:MAG: hypothetical protein KU28_01665 [Sulfurovum sp. PC08-66]KIM12644.1 MAG: hypothetical protein KU37_01770 [Sulfuricurvum sp. PC08-66]
MLDRGALEALQKGKNLLAFSGGIDSSALFFLLVEADVPFDMAIVDYGVRSQSIEEVAYAQSLAQRYSKKCHVHYAPPIPSDFEAVARRIRYDYFASLAQEHGYTTLVTAHQLNDQMEWFLMQLAKGAGALELLGMQFVQKRAEYTLVRPLLHQPKAALQSYLDTNGYTYFVDESNVDMRYARNAMRHHFSDPFVAQYAKGVAQSFAYIAQDAALLSQGIQERRIQGLTLIDAPHRRGLIFAADKVLKTQGLMLSSSQKEWLAQHDGLLVARKIALEIVGNRAYIAPYVTGVTLSKEFKEACRKAAIPPHIRPYCYQQNIAISTLLNND